MDNIQISIPSFATLTDAEGKYSSFRVVVSTTFSSWEVDRRYRQFFDLHTRLTETLRQEKNLPLLPKKKVLGSSLQQSFVEDRRAALEVYLRQVVSLQSVQVNMAPLLEFLEDKSRSLLGILEMSRLKTQLASVNELVSSMDGMLRSTVEELKRAVETIDDLRNRVQVLESEREESAAAAKPTMLALARPTSVDYNKSFLWSLGGVAENGDRTNSSAGSSAEASIALDDLQVSSGNTSTGSTASASLKGREIKDSYADRLSNASLASSIEEQSTSNTDRERSVSSPNPGYFIKQVLGLDQASPQLLGSASVTSLMDLPERRSSFELSDRASDPILEADSRSWSKVVGSIGGGSVAGGDMLSSGIVPHRRPSYKSVVLQPEILRCNQEPSLWDNLIEEIVTMVQPQEAQLQYRQSAFRFVARHACKILGAQVYEIGPQGLACFLPDDPIRLSVYLSRGLEAGWYVRLNEQLCRMSSGLPGQPSAYNAQNFLHTLSNVSFTTNADDPGHKLTCLVDSVLGLEVLANVRQELCLMGFMEDFDRLLGKNHLFKRSILLIRAWWIYEANMTAASGISDAAFCVMIISVLNRYHDRIFHTLQALAFFLAEYSCFDFGANIITLNGPIPYEVFTSASYAPSFLGCLVSADFLQRYQNLAAATDDDDGLPSSVLSSDVAVFSDPHGLPPGSFGRSSSGSPSGAKAFAQKSIMILHPLVPMKNMISDAFPLLHRRSIQVMEAFHAGATNLIPMLTADNGGALFSAHTIVESYFKNVMTRFGRGWRPDAPTSMLHSSPSGNTTARWNSSDSISPFASVEGSTFELHQQVVDLAPRDLFSISLDKLWAKIRYCNLILESQVSESALRTLSRQVLGEKGPLPVGEIGKMLQEACTGMSCMSTVLKERFGGLKKFLERYPDDFVLSNDHPFNPNVYLRNTLTNEELAAVLRGESIVRAPSTSNSKLRKQQRGSLNGRGGAGKKPIKVGGQTPPLESSGGYPPTMQYPPYRLSLDSCPRLPPSNQRYGAGIGSRSLTHLGADIFASDSSNAGLLTTPPHRSLSSSSVLDATTYGVADISPLAPEFVPQWSTAKR